LEQRASDSEGDPDGHAGGQSGDAGADEDVSRRRTGIVAGEQREQLGDAHPGGALGEMPTRGREKRDPQQQQGAGGAERPRRPMGTVGAVHGRTAGG
jgi:hypothetical protein